ncbi:MAG TPA: hypothetical protein VNA25_08085 [Phycisphaerae bacterium]|nr:hypothetical protein [Phycisphaerae bacterium]
MSANVQFTPQDWQRVREAWSAWWAGELARPIVMLERSTVPAEELPDAPGFVPQLGLDMPADEVVDRYEAHLAARRYYGEAWPKWWVNFGPGVMAGFLGARVNVAPSTVWFEPAGPVGEIAELDLRYDADNVWWRRVQDLTRAAVRRWGDSVSVGITDLGGNLDILSSFRTPGQMMLDLCDAPEHVERLIRRITELWLRYYAEQHAVIGPAGAGTTPWAAIWSPHRCYMLQCDASYMFSPAMFERFVLPDLEACCNALEHAFYHLDGKGQLAHLDMLLSIGNLRGVQWIPGAGQPEPQDWLDVLGRIRKAGKLCQVYVSPEGAMKIVRELGGMGFALAVGPAPKDDREAEDFLSALAAADRGRA